MEKTYRPVPEHARKAAIFSPGAIHVALSALFFRRVLRSRHPTFGLPLSVAGLLLTRLDRMWGGAAAGMRRQLATQIEDA